MSKEKEIPKRLLARGKSRINLQLEITFKRYPKDCSRKRKMNNKK